MSRLVMTLDLGPNPRVDRVWDDWWKLRGTILVL